MPISDPAPSPSAAWRPPSNRLQFADGVWHAPQCERVSYPSNGNDECYPVEDRSFWFDHRLSCIHAAMSRVPPEGTLYDLGGGNGQVASALEARGLPVVLLEPGPGAFNARRRGLKHIIHATLESAGLQENSLPAAGAFDVLEHIESSSEFLSTVHRLLVPRGKFYCTVPAYPALWSHDDEHAGHFIRYTKRTLLACLQTSGFEVRYCSHFFSWLVGPVLIRRALPWRLGMKRNVRPRSHAEIRRDHTLPDWLAPFTSAVNAWELRRIVAGQGIACGTSLLCVAEARR